MQEPRQSVRKSKFHTLDNQGFLLVCSAPKIDHFTWLLIVCVCALLKSERQKLVQPNRSSRTACYGHGIQQFVPKLSDDSSATAMDSSPHWHLTKWLKWMELDLDSRVCGVSSITLDWETDVCLLHLCDAQLDWYLSSEFVWRTFEWNQSRSH